MLVELTSEITKKKYSGNNYEKTLKSMKEDEERFVNAKKEKSATDKEVASVKKALCDKIDEAEKLVQEAHAHYVDTYKNAETDIISAKEVMLKAQEDARKVYQNRVEANRKAIDNARNAEAEARKTYNQLVADYHNRFDKNYTKVLYGEDAVKEYNRICKELNDMNPFFPFFF